MSVGATYYGKLMRSAGEDVLFALLVMLIARDEYRMILQFFGIEKLLPISYYQKNLKKKMLTGSP